MRSGFMEMVKPRLEHVRGHQLEGKGEVSVLNES